MKTWITIIVFLFLNNVLNAQRYEAESAALSGTTIATGLTDYSGTGYVDGLDMNTDRITFTINKTTADLFNLKFRFANSCGACTKQQKIIINGGIINYINFVATTAAWNTFDYGNIYLNAGNNTIVIESSNGWSYFDYIDLTWIDPNDTQLPTAPSNLSITKNSYTMFELGWTAATDNFGVKGYIIFKNGVTFDSTPSLTYKFSRLLENTTYDIQVKAYDNAGNVSIAANLNAKTLKLSDTIKYMLGTNFWFLDYNTDGSIPWTGEATFVPNVNFNSATNPWSQTFLEEVSIYNIYRFMDWNNTNYHPYSLWMDRTYKTDLQKAKPLPGSTVLSGSRYVYGLAYEWMIDLCNRQGKNMWLNIPHKTINEVDFPNGNNFNNEYVHKLAILMKYGIDMNTVNLKTLTGGNLSTLSNYSEAQLITAGGIKTIQALDSTLKIYLEYSNETWLFGTHHVDGQNFWCRTHGQKLGYDTLTTNGQGEMYHAWAAIRVWQAFKDVYGNKFSKRIIRVLAGNWGETWRMDNQMTLINSATANPWNQYPDYFTLSYYTSSSDGSATDAFNQFYDGTYGIYPLSATRESFKNYSISKFGIRLVAYEGGQHYTTNADVFSKDSRVYDAYKTWLTEGYKAYDVICHYTNAGKYSSGGAWGAKESTGQSLTIAHKYRALYDWVNEHSASTIPVTGVTLSHSILNLTKGNKDTLTAFILPANATTNTIVWSSSNNLVATVNNLGIVNALDSGIAIITVTTSDGNFTASCNVSVAPITSANCSTVVFNQEINGKVWFSLGTHSLKQGTNNTVAFDITPLTEGVVVMDAIKFTKAGQTDIIIDNMDTAFISSVGTWTKSTSSSGYYGINYHTSNIVGNSFIFKPNIPVAGDWQVFIWYTSFTNRANNATAKICNVSVTKSNQSITFNTLPDKLTTDSPFTISATVSSGLPLTYSIVSGPATINGNLISLTGAMGLVRVKVKVSQIGDVNYNPAIDITRSFNVTFPVDVTKITADEIRLYPNPTKGIIEIKNMKTEKVSIAILNVLGEKIVSNYLINGNIIDISKFNNSVYFIAIKQDDNLINIFKLIKN